MKNRDVPRLLQLWSFCPPFGAWLLTMIPAFVVASIVSTDADDAWSPLLWASAFSAGGVIMAIIGVRRRRLGVDLVRRGMATTADVDYRRSDVEVRIALEGSRSRTEDDVTEVALRWRGSDGYEHTTPYRMLGLRQAFYRDGLPRNVDILADPDDTSRVVLLRDLPVVLAGDQVMFTHSAGAVALGALVYLAPVALLVAQGAGLVTLVIAH